MNTLEIVACKSKRKLTMVTCYDAWSAKLLAQTAVDMLLVGDSGAMVMHGFEDTIPATVEMMAMMVAAVKRGAGSKFIVADLPFLANRSDLATNIRDVRTLMQAGAQALKLEGFEGNEALIRHLVESGVPIMGHLGLTPQSVNTLGGFKVQGRGEDKARHIVAQARGLEACGCFALVLECVPGPLAREISSAIAIPTIGIGAGVDCDGQVLVLHDLLGFNEGFKPKFLRPYLNGAEQIKAAVETYCNDVQHSKFPSERETYE